MKLSFPTPQALLAEFLGTFVFVFVACGVVLTSQLFQDVGVVGAALAGGLTLMAMIYATSGISGGQLNPAVTLAAWFSQRMNVVEAACYIAAQLLAGFVAAFALFAVFGARSFEFYFGGPVLSVDTNLQAALVLEAILTAVLVFAYFATVVDKRGPASFGPMVIGLIVVVSGIFAGPISGAVLNPAKAVGPLVTAGHYDSLLVWIVGPLVGSLIGFIYPFLFLPSKKKKS
ncbi:aquaporin [Candidatus Curtissbacteria bacterium]|nr:aquaporin [Candidatus Curtissbacteria bacterium]